ncbi:MAG TPA: cytochrome b/b6 domain-containing protein [Rhodocyclaceae bacterium]|nr:cytochrome b/b6 domain-containing protein [Rhodocyclaceae bacterium]
MSEMTSSIDAAGEAPPASATKARVWDLPTRVFHWSLAASFTGAWLSAESERWRDIHVVLGYTLAGLIAFRLVWGVVGSRYARFSSFAFPPSRLVGYLKSLLNGQPEHHLGHNPAGALAIFALLVLGVAVAASGYATYQEVGGEWLEDLHEGAANAMLLLVFVHLAGVVVSGVLHRENLVRAMFTGWKPGPPEQGIARNHGLLGVVLLVAVLGFWAYSQSAAGRAFLAGSPEQAETRRLGVGGAAADDRGDRHERRGDDDRRRKRKGDRDDD